MKLSFFWSWKNFAIKFRMTYAAAAQREHIIVIVIISDKRERATSAVGFNITVVKRDPPANQNTTTYLSQARNCVRLSSFRHQPTQQLCVVASSRALLRCWHIYDFNKRKFIWHYSALLFFLLLTEERGANDSVRWRYMRRVRVVDDAHTELYSKKKLK